MKPTGRKIAIFIWAVLFSMISEIGSSMNHSLIDASDKEKSDSSSLTKKQSDSLKTLKTKLLADSLYTSGNYLKALKAYKKVEKRGDTSEYVKSMIASCIFILDTADNNFHGPAYDSLNLINKIRLFFADRSYYQEKYVRSAKRYSAFLSKNDTTYYVISRLADSYRKNNKSTESEYWYGVILKKGFYRPLDILYLSEALKMNMKYDSAAYWLSRYYIMIEDTVALHANKEVPEYINELLNSTSRFIVEPLTVNSAKSDFGTAFYHNNIVFSSARKLNLISGSYGWNEEPFLDLFLSSVDKKGQLNDPVVFSKELSTNYHEGPVCFSPDFTVIYFTRNHFSRRSTDGERVNRLKIMQAENIAGKWQKIQEMPFNNPQYSVGHPAVNQTGDLMYFVSDMPGGFGGTDIYRTYKKDSVWSEPENLGDVINTPGNEMFPFIHPDGTLYFSSDGHPGLGGLDVFYALPAGNNFLTPQNLRYPVNSSKDDFAFILDKTNYGGYFSSNRDNGDDNIFRFMMVPLPPVAVDDFYSIRAGTEKIDLFPLQNDRFGDCKFLKISSIEKSTRGGFVIFDDNAVNPVYFPKEGFTGTDTIRYTVCDTFDFRTSCDDGLIVVEVKPTHLILSGKVVNKKTDVPVDNARMVITNRLTGSKTEVFSASDGRFSLQVDRNTDFDLTCTREDYRDASDRFSTFNISGDTLKLIERMEMFPYAMEGIVVYSKTSVPVEGVEIFLRDQTDKVISSLVTGKDGAFYFPLEENSSYTVFLKKDELLNRTRFLTTKETKPGIIKMRETVEMLKLEKGAGLEVEILFDLGKWNIRPDAAKILDEEVIQFVRDNPTVTFEFGAHTDSRGTAADNQSLSQKRAESAVQYMVNKGIDKNKISAKGYGESQLKNRCKDGVKCSEEEHQQNRRVEIKVVDF